MLDGRPIEPLELAQLCQRAERGFVGVPSGIMDQYVAIFGREGSAIEIDCRSLTHQVVTLPRDVRILAVNSMVKHQLGQSAYRQRTEECAAAVEIIRTRYPQTRSLRDVDSGILAEMEGQLPEPIRRRARHVVSEDERMGRLFVQSHRSLQLDYEVSCAELDFLVDTAVGMNGVFGARMTGGGFGGCTVNLVDPAAAAGFESEIAKRYEQRFAVRPQVFGCRPSGGAAEIRA